MLSRAAISSAGSGRTPKDWIDLAEILLGSTSHDLDGHPRPAARAPAVCPPSAVINEGVTVADGATVEILSN